MFWHGTRLLRRSDAWKADERKVKYERYRNCCSAALEVGDREQERAFYKSVHLVWFITCQHQNMSRE
jgi:hypothetical protein